MPVQHEALEDLDSLVCPEDRPPVLHQYILPPSLLCRVTAMCPHARALCSLMVKAKKWPGRNLEENQRCWLCWLELDVLEGPLQPKPYYDTVIP